MKRYLLPLVLLVATQNIVVGNTTDQQQYRAQYKALVNKWLKEPNADKRKALKIEIEKLKKTNKYVSK